MKSVEMLRNQLLNNKLCIDAGKEPQFFFYLLFVDNPAIYITPNKIIKKIFLDSTSLLPKYFITSLIYVLGEEKIMAMVISDT